MPRDRARALSRRGTRTITDLANDYAFTYAPFIRAAVMEVGHNYRQVAKWLTRERIPAQRDGKWAAQSVKNLTVRYYRLTGRRLLVSHNRFPTPAHRKAPRLVNVSA
jgi:predicted deacetylase